MNHAMKSLVKQNLIGLLLVMSVLLVSSESTYAEETPVERVSQTVSVKRLVPTPASADEAQMEPMPAMMAAPPEPTLPSGKLPQYQVGEAMDLPAPFPKDSDTLRFLLVLPERLVLIEAHVTVDGTPLPELRRNRIRSLLDGEDESDSAHAYIQRYRKATGEAPSFDEIAWLLEKRVDGPIVLWLNNGFQRFRADQRPVFHLLDRNSDDTISAEELANAVKTFQSCDLNRDDIVTYTEIAEVANDPRHKTNPQLGTMQWLYPLPREIDDGTFFRSLEQGGVSLNALQRLDTDQNGSLEPSEYEQFLNQPADLVINLAFHTSSEKPSQLTVSTLNSAAFTTKNETNKDTEATSIEINIANSQLSISSVQSLASDQFSIGVVSDGYPLLPALDLDDDGRFTIRELRELLTRLRKFDSNEDGNISRLETQSTIRLCFALGPFVHTELAGIRSLNPKTNITAVTGPDWFERMDRNDDHDLSRSEFPGTDEQFAALDADDDQLISAAEANAYDQQTNTTEEDQTNATQAADTDTEQLDSPATSPASENSETE